MAVQVADADRALSQLRVVIFSKDRPCQLYSCLVSLLQSAKGCTLDIRVIYLAAPYFEGSYDRLAALLPSVSFLKEGPLSFAEILRQQFQGDGHVLLTVDDALWIREFDASATMGILDERQDILVVHLKLAPGMSYAQPPDVLMRHPPLQSASAPRSASAPLDLLKSHMELVTFNRTKGEADWNYPWDLSGAVYRLGDAHAVFDAVEQTFGIEGVAHPNVFEGHGQRLLKEQRVHMPHDRRLCACLSAPAMVVITVNRVQSRFANPLAGDERSVEELEDDFRGFLAARKSQEAPDVYDYSGNAACWPPLFSASPYQACVSSVHQPLKPPHALQLPPLVSWLVPVFNGAATVLDSLASIRMASEGVTWEAVFVDDGSTDGSGELLADVAASDARVRVLRQPNQSGIAASLNFGLEACHGDVVFRLDADDLACPRRVHAQLQHLEEHPEISVVGGCIRTFSATKDGGFALNRMYYPFPVEPGRVRWELLFTCPLAHPAVALRRSLVAEHGPLYPAVPAEDHACWLRLAQRGVQLGNVPDTVTLIRRHSGSRSANHAKDLKMSSQQEVANFLSGLLASHAPEESGPARLQDVAALWGDSIPSSNEDAAAASRLLDVAMHAVPASPAHVRKFCEEDCRRRKAALTCSCLASGDVDAGAMLLRGLLAARTSGGQAPRSLGELLGT